MATDATGTPTSLGIPKFNTSADAPSGLGTNAMMDAIDALIAARVTKPAGIVSGEAAVWNGSGWDRSSVTRIGPTSLGSGTPDTTKFLRGDGAWATPSGQTTYRKTSQKDVVNTVTETDLLNGEITVGANVMGASGMLRVTLEGDYLNTSGSQQGITLRVKFGTTTVWGDATVATQYSSSATRRRWFMNFLITNQGATNVQDLAGFFFMNAVAAGSVAGLGDLGTTDTTETTFGGTAAEDTTASKALAVTVVHTAANASLSMRLQSALVEVI